MARSLGPDATGVGWVFQYVVRGAQKSLAELRTIQDWYVRYGIANAEGVAEVASVGGFVKQYSVVVNPRRLQAMGIPLARIREAKHMRWKALASGATSLSTGGSFVNFATEILELSGQANQPITIAPTHSAIAMVESQPRNRNQPPIMNFPIILE